MTLEPEEVIHREASLCAEEYIRHFRRDIPAAEMADCLDDFAKFNTQPRLIRACAKDIRVYWKRRGVECPPQTDMERIALRIHERIVDLVRAALLPLN